MKISFCTNCKGRLWQLEQTIFKNMSMLEDDCEMVLLDYQSPDGLEEFIRTHFDAELTSGKLKYFKLMHDYNYSCAYAKNVVHRLATGTILFNLDADNFIQPGLVDELRGLRKNKILHHITKSTPIDSGSFGRIGYHAEAFHRLNGYRESIIGMGADDGDLISRAINAKMSLHTLWSKEDHIRNDLKDKTKYTKVEGLTQPPVDYPLIWGKATVTNINGEIIEVG